MSAAGRLWRRAPAWRLCLIAGLASTALAAMFPPARPRWTHLAATGAPSGSTAQFIPSGVTSLPDYGESFLPPPGDGRTGTIPFAGRQMPLPAGRWQELLIGRGSKPVPQQVAIYARIEDGHTTGLLVATATDPVVGAPGIFATPRTCFVANTLARDIVPDVTARPMDHECWTLTGEAMKDLVATEPKTGLLGRSFTRLKDSGATIPDRMLTIQYLRSDASLLFGAMLLVPMRQDSASAGFHRLEAWVRKYAAALHKGFDGKLQAGEAMQAVTRDPD